MSRHLVLAILLAFAPLPLFAEGDDGPPISITSPDSGSTYSLATVKSRSLYWNKKDNVLIARITFIDPYNTGGNQTNDDTLQFRLPGISFDEATGNFTAKSAKGEVIPVAHYKKVLFVKTIEATPNANVLIIHPRGGNVSIRLEAISLSDARMHPAPADPDGEHKVDIQKILGN